MILTLNFWAVGVMFGKESLISNNLKQSAQSLGRSGKDHVKSVLPCHGKGANWVIWPQSLITAGVRS